MATPAPEPFVMHGARAAMTAGLTHIGEQIEGIEQAVVDNPALAFDLAKVLIETICKVVLDGLPVSYKEDDDLPKLFNSVKQHLSFLPATASTASKVRKSIEKTLNGLSTAIQGVCELRNQCGFASHGSGCPRPAMEGVQALLAAKTADAIVGFLHGVHRQNQTPSPAKAPSFDENTAFNESLDEAFGPFQIREVVFHASEVLFSLDPEAYRIYLAEFDGDSETKTSTDE